MLFSWNFLTKIGLLFFSAKMNRRLLASLLKQSWRPSSTSTGLFGQQQPTQAIPSHQYPKVDPFSLVSKDLNSLVGNIHKELDNELTHHSELGEMSK